jgi:hypothetical protein
VEVHVSKAQVQVALVQRLRARTAQSRPLPLARARPLLGLGLGLCYWPGLGPAGLCTGNRGMTSPAPLAGVQTARRAARRRCSRLPAARARHAPTPARAPSPAPSPLPAGATQTPGGRRTRPPAGSAWACRWARGDQSAAAPPPGGCPTPGRESLGRSRTGSGRARSRPAPGSDGAHESSKFRVACGRDCRRRERAACFSECSVCAPQSALGREVGCRVADREAAVVSQGRCQPHTPRAVGAGLRPTVPSA